MKTHRFFTGLLLLIALTAQAQFDYVTNNGIAIITGYSGPSGPVTIPSVLGGLPVTVIEGSGFENRGITSVAIPDTVTNIQTQEFAPNDELTSFTVDSNNPAYHSADGVLFNKSGTTLVEYPPGISGPYSIPTNVTLIGQNAFAACYFLSGVTIPSSVTNIGPEGFGFCFGLTSVTIPSSVTSMGPDVFINCENLSAIAVAAGNPAYTSVGGVLFDKNETTLLQFPTALGGNYAIPNGVLDIGTNAFVLCDGLTGVTIPASVTTLSDGAFADCDGLTNVTLGAGVSDLVYTAFGGCVQLQTINVDPVNPFFSSINGVVLNKNQTTIIKFPPGYAGGYTTPASVTSIADYAFEDCNLTDLIISGNVASIGFDSFQGCGDLTNVTMANGVETLGEFAFGDSPKLATVTIPSSVTFLPFGAFAYDGLTSVSFLGNSPDADPQAFLGDSGALYYQPGTSGWGPTFEGLTTELVGAPNPNGALQVALLPAGVGAAGARWQVDDGFLQPDGATVLGLSVGTHTLSFTSLGGWAAPVSQVISVNANATNMASATYIEEAAPSSDFSFVTNDGTITISGYLGTGGAVEIPSVIDGLPVTVIGQFAFANISFPISVIIPDSVTNLGAYAFSACYGLSDVTISQGVTTIGTATFQDCTSLSNVTIRGVLTSLGDDAFASCFKLDSFPIPDTVTNLGQYEFFGGGLTNITIPASVINIGEAAFLDCNALPAINVDSDNPSYSSAGGVLFDKNQTVLEQYPDGRSGTSYVIPNTVISIGDTAFQYSVLANVTIPSSVTNIGDYAFESCASLASVVLPSNLTTMGNNAFAFCSELTGVTLPASLTSLGDVAFAGCVNMTAISVAEDNPAFASVDGALYNKAETLLVEFPGGPGGNFAVPDGVRDIGLEAFESAQIGSVMIPGSVTNIEEFAFSGCSDLGSVSMANNVTAIGVAAFQNCNQLTNLILSTSLTNIGFSAFSDCSALKTVVIPRAVTSLSDYAFAYCSTLTAAYFGGGAPTDDATVFFNDSSATVYYLPGAPDWTSTFGTAPTVPEAQVASLGVAGPNLVFDAIGGQSGRNYILLAATDLSAPWFQWTPVTTNLLGANGNFVLTLTNAFNPNLPHLFYTLQTR